MKWLFFISFIFSQPYNYVFSQITFSKSIDLDEQIDEGVAIRVIDSGYLLVGGSHCFSNSVECYSILKTDFSGNIIWKKQFTNYPYHLKPEDGYGNHSIATRENTDFYFFSGLIENPGRIYDYFLMKTDLNGDSIWSHSYGTAYKEYNSTVFYRTDSTLLLFGDKFINSSIFNKIWLVETDLNGNVIWEKIFGENNNRLVRQDIVQLNNGDIVFTYTMCKENNFCIVGDDQVLKITKMNREGDEVWTKVVYSYTEFWRFSSMISLDNGGFLISFNRENFYEEGWWYPPILIWLDSLGNFVNEYDFPKDDEMTIKDITKTSNGTILGAGYVDKLDNGIGGWVFAMSQEGELLWNREIVDLRFPAKLSLFNAVEESEDGGVILIGYIIDTLSNSQENNQNIWLVKLDSLGCLDPKCNDLQIITNNLDPVSEIKECLIYPNPASNELNIKSDLNGHNNSAIIRNYLGQKILKIIIEDEINKVNISSLSNGIYFVEILDDNGVIVEVHKIVVLK